MSFLEFALESSLLVVIVMGIRRIFTGRIRYAAIYALWFLVFLRFLIPVNFVATPLSIGRIIPAGERSLRSLSGRRSGEPLRAKVPWDGRARCYPVSAWRNAPESV